MSHKTEASAGGVGKFATGTFTGNGQATQAITGVGFQPVFVFMWKYSVADVQDTPIMKSSVDGVYSFRYRSIDAIVISDDIISLDADGFTVGDGTPWFNVCNVNAVVYCYICFG